MKLFAVIVINVMIYIHMGVVSAEVRSSTAEEFKQALYYSVKGLSVTDDYLSVITNGNVQDLQHKLKVCEYEYNVLYDMHSQNVIKGKEARVCVFNAMIILQERHLALMYLSNAATANARGNYSEYERCLEKVRKYIKSANDLRQQFKATYGY